MMCSLWSSNSFDTKTFAALLYQDSFSNPIEINSFATFSQATISSCTMCVHVTNQLLMLSPTVGILIYPSVDWYFVVIHQYCFDNFCNWSSSSLTLGQRWLVVASFIYPASTWLHNRCDWCRFKSRSEQFPTTTSKCVTFYHQIRHVVYRNFGFELFNHDPSDHRRIINDDYYLASFRSLSLSLSLSLWWWHDVCVTWNGQLWYDCRSILIPKFVADAFV